MKILKNENGRTMVEMIGVISVIGLLSITSIGGYNILNRNWEVSRMEDALLKVLLVVEGGQVKTMNALNRFLGQSMPGIDATAAQINICAKKDRRHPHCYKITFPDLNENIVTYFKENAPKEYAVNESLSQDEQLVIEFSSSKNLD